MNRSTKIVHRLSAVGLGFWGTCLGIANVWAQSTTTVQVSFSAPEGAPISPWMLVLMSGALATTGFLLLRRSGTGRMGRLGAWLLAGVAASALFIAAKPGTLMSSAYAIPASSFATTLSVSPAVVNITGAINGNAFVTVTNGLATPAVITGVTLQNPVSGEQIVQQPGACVAHSTILQTGDTCIVSVLNGGS